MCLTLISSNGDFWLMHHCSSETATITITSLGHILISNEVFSFFTSFDAAFSSPPACPLLNQLDTSYMAQNAF